MPRSQLFFAYLFRSFSKLTRAPLRPLSAAATLPMGSVPIIMRFFNLLLVAFCLGNAVLLADPLPYLQRIEIDRSEFAVSRGTFPSAGETDFAEHETTDNFDWRGRGKFDAATFDDRASCPGPGPTPAPEPGYEWAFGLLLIGFGSISRWRIRNE